MKVTDTTPMWVQLAWGNVGSRKLIWYWLALKWVDRNNAWGSA